MLYYCYNYYLCKHIIINIFLIRIFSRGSRPVVRNVVPFKAKELAVLNTRPAAVSLLQPHVIIIIIIIKRSCRYVVLHGFQIDKGEKNSN